MAVKILELKRESCPAARLIGKNMKVLQIGANGIPERWIGMFFPVNTEVPEGFEYVDIEPLDYAISIQK